MIRGDLNGKEISKERCHMYMYTMEYYSVIESNQIVPFVEMWMDPEIVIPSEVSQKEKNKYRTLTHICRI